MGGCPVCCIFISNSLYVSGSYLLIIIIIVRKCLLSFGAESFVLQVATKKFKDQDIENYNFACCFVWV